MRTWTVLSGKGGAGKTTLTAAFAQIMDKTILADCDVDGADLSLILKGEEQFRERFYSGVKASIRPESCSRCGICYEYCRFGAVKREQGTFSIMEDLCEGCGVCGDHCPDKAVEFSPHDTGICLVTETGNGPLVHARLHPGGDNSGKLVTRVKEIAEGIAQDRGLERILIDGPPGIGCPVLASMNQSEQVLIVTEPTPSGMHDLERLRKVLKHFGIPGSLCVNKADIHPGLTRRIREKSRGMNLRWLGEIPFDPAVPAALREGKTPRDAHITPVYRAIEQIWEAWNESM